MAPIAPPYPHLEQATAGLRAELRHRLLQVGDAAAPCRKTLEVTRPVEVRDDDGRALYEYRGELAAPH
jgi:hypothetical protein